MDAAITQKVDKWLNGNFDDDTKTQIKQLQTSNEEELADAFYRTWNLVPVACGASWALVPTG